MERVKKAKPADFPKLNEEWEDVFPNDENYEDGYPPNALNALRWMYGVWLVKDPDGFLKAISSGSLDYDYYAAQAMVELMPEMAAEWIVSAEREADESDFIDCVASELAKKQPALYLKMDPDGTRDFTPDNGGDVNWLTAIQSLAKIDAVAAGNACLLGNFANGEDCFYRAIQAVADAWKTRDLSMSEWAKGIADPKMRNFVNHAWLSALADKDPRAALKALDRVELEYAYPNAPSHILGKLAEADPIEALKLLNELEGVFAKYKPSDPFAEHSAEETAEIAAHPLKGVLESGGEIARDSVLDGMAGNLPDDPASLIAAMHKLSEGMGSGDVSWHLDLMGDMIRRKSGQWSVDTCLAAAALWASEAEVAPDDATLQQLATRAAREDTEQAFAGLAGFTEVARSVLAGEIIQQLPATDAERRISLFSQLSPAQWDRKLGQALGKNGEDYASAIASLPSATTLGALGGFMQQWGEQDPEAAAQWLQTLPTDAVEIPGAGELAYAWIRFDPDAAAAWANSLPDGPVRDGAAYGISTFLSGSDSKEYAWHWADAISDPKMRAKGYDRVARSWDEKAPEEFRTAHDKVRKEAGLPSFEY